MFKYIFVGFVAVIAYVRFFFEAALTNEAVGQLFIGGILASFVVFLIFKFGLHYKIAAINRYVIAFYYTVFEYKKVQLKPSDLDFYSSVREQAEVAIAANFDPALKTAELKIPVSLYSGKDPFLDKLRAKIQEAEKLKREARHLEGKANVLLDKTQDILIEKDLIEKESPAIMDGWFDIEKGITAIIDLTTSEIKEQSYGRTPDYEIITHIALDNNPYFANTYKFFDSEDVANILNRAPFMVILLGIIGTFSGFYLALAQGGDIKSGAAVAIVSSLVGLPVSLLMDYINTLFPDRATYQHAFNKYKVSLEILFNHETELSAIKQDRRKKE